MTGHGLPAGGPDLIHHGIGTESTVLTSSDIIGHHSGPPPGQLQGMGPADAGTRTGHQSGLSLKIDHSVAPV
jgi:hypothetical protein